MRVPEIKVATPSDEAPVIATIALAFAADPVARWCWPDSQSYLSSVPSFARAFGGRAFTTAGAYCTQDYSAAALWLPPGIEPDEENLGEIIERTVSPFIQQDLFGVLEQMAGYHPDEAHWYLPLIGVDPTHQGNGYGTLLMNEALKQCDQNHVAAYLESSNPRNIPLYSRLGFEIMGRIQAGSSPPIVPMLRPAR